jgi:hypothetical protein
MTSSAGRHSRQFLYVARMDVPTPFEQLFNVIYDSEHLPALLTVPGVLAARRYKGSTEDRPRYVALYRIADPAVLKSQAWNEARDRGRWPDEVRPRTKYRSHGLYELVSGKGISLDEAKICCLWLALHPPLSRNVVTSAAPGISQYNAGLAERPQVLITDSRVDDRSGGAVIETQPTHGVEVLESRCFLRL